MQLLLLLEHKLFVYTTSKETNSKEEGMDFKSIALAATAIAFSINANAEVITFNESTDGDLGTDVWYFDLGYGLNTFSGTTSYVDDADGNLLTLDFDGFFFGVGPNMKVTSFTVTTNTITNTTPDRPDYLMEAAFNFSSTTIIDTSPESFFFISTPDDKDYGTFELARTPGQTLDLYTYEEQLPFFTPFNIDEPLLEGHYDIRAKYLGPGIMEYTYAIEVSPVPIPAAVWLFSSGLIGLIGVARRKKT